MAAASMLRAGLLLPALLLSSCALPEGQPPGESPDAPPRSPAAASPEAGSPEVGAAAEEPTYPPCDPRPGAPEMGVFRDSTRTELTDEFEEWLGCRVEYVIDFPARDTWTTISRPDYLVEAWAGEQRTLVFSLAMLPTDEQSTFEAGVRGDYDEYFAEFGQALVDGGRQDAIVRLAWEFNLEESRWYTDNPEQFRAYWRRIIEVLRGVEGQQFTFLWNPGRSGVDAVPYYPGDDVVDHIGVDVYDATGAAGTYPYPPDCDEACRLERNVRAWDEEIYGGDTGLAYYSAFARSRDKPLTLPEWGLWERPDGFAGGENLFFIRRMHDFISEPAHNVAWHAYFEYDGSDGEHRLMTTFPDAGELFRDLFVVEQP